MIEHIFWLGHGSFRIDGPTRIYIDPWRVPPGSPPADAILISHEHYDHFSPSDIERLVHSQTQIIASEAVAKILGQELPVTSLRPWQSVNVKQANIKGIPAYTFNDYHPATRQDLGFMIAMNHYDIYYAGDTDFVPELKRLRADIAILPVSAKEGIMTITEAAELVKAIRPTYVIPSHYGTPEGGTRLNAQALESAVGANARLVWLEARA